MRLRIIAGLLTMAVIGLFGVLFLQRRLLITISNPSGPSSPVLSYSPIPSVSPSPEITATPPPTNFDQTRQSEPNATGLSEQNFVGQVNLIIPVANVRSDQLLDTFADARSEGRTHDAIDIPAPEGTPVLAAADGEIVKLFQSEKGGITIYQSNVDKKLIFYYAHLQGYSPTLHEGQSVRQGETVAYVGDTGNAGAGNFHLHFSIAVVSDPKRYWEGTNINPFPLLRK